MEEFSLLDNKCFANMPMLLEVVAKAINGLNDVFSSVYNDLEKVLQTECEFIKYEIEEYFGGAVYIMGDEKDFKNRYLENLSSKVTMPYGFKIVEKKKKKCPSLFFVEFGYRLKEDALHDIYFQIDATSTQIDMNDFFYSIDKKEFSYAWNFYIEDDIVCIQFDVDETLSVDKIKKCAEDFKNYILKPFFSLLNT